MKKFRKGNQVRVLGQYKLGTVVRVFQDRGVNWCVVRLEDQSYAVFSEAELKKIPHYIHTSLDLSVYEDQQRLMDNVVKVLAANSPYLDVLRGACFPARAAELIREVK